jgi:hypothetical protein
MAGNRIAVLLSIAHSNSLPGGAIMNTLLRLTLCCAGFAVAAPIPATNANPISTQCTGDEYRQLDFWIGDWDVYETTPPQGPAVARARVEPVAQGCAIRERYEQADGLIGESLLSYDSVRKAWQQTWITNRGAFMAIAGNLADGRLVLEGDVHLKDGSTVKQRITWQQQDGAVRESAALSKDGGKSWAPAFDLVFRKRAR